MKRDVGQSVVVITGASSGIGRAVALLVAQRGGTVVLASRQQSVLDDLADRCRRLGGQALAVATDVCDEKQVQQLCRRAIETFGRIDCWINNAAVTVFSRFESTPPEASRRVIETNLFGCINGCRAVLPWFREQGHGTLMNVSSIVGKVGSPFVSIYSTTKFAIAGLTESIRMECRDAPEIHIVTIAPPSVDTPIFQHAANYSGRSIKALDPVYPVKRMARAIVRAIEHPCREVTVGASPRQIMAMRVLMPAQAERYMADKVNRDHFTDQPADDSRGNLFDPDPKHNTMSGGWRENGKSSMGLITTLAAAGIGAGLLAWMLRARDGEDGRGSNAREATLWDQPQHMAVTGA